MSLDAALDAVPDRTDGQFALESPEGGFYFGELHVLTPESVGVRSTSGSESACRLNQITNCSSSCRAGYPRPAQGQSDQCCCQAGRRCEVARNGQSWRKRHPTFKASRMFSSNERGGAGMGKSRRRTRFAPAYVERGNARSVEPDNWFRREQRTVGGIRGKGGAKPSSSSDRMVLECLSRRCSTGRYAGLTSPESRVNLAWRLQRAFLGEHAVRVTPVQLHGLRKGLLDAVVFRSMERQVPLC